MDILNSVFEKVFVINLDRRPERMRSFINHMKERKIESFERVSGIDGRNVTFNNPDNLPHFSPGDVGCTLSHLEVVKKAQLEGLENYLVFEDDVNLRKGFSQIFKLFWVEVPEDWDMVYFGANHNGKVPEKITDKIIKVNGSFTTHAMAVKSTMYEDLIKVWSNPIAQVDVLLSSLHSKYNCYCFHPNLAGQREGFSDILNKDVNYDFLLNL